MDPHQTVLVCEDDPVQLKILTAALAQAHFRTLSARTPAEALRTLGDRRVDAVLSDVNLQGGSAFDILGTMRRNGLGAPLVMISAWSTPALKENALRRGAAQFLEKPVEFASVPRAVNRAIQAQGGIGLGESILVIEDHAQVRKLLQEVLAKAGYRPVTAESGEEALRLLEKRETRFDLALVDLHLPGISGAALIEQIERLSPGLYVIMMSGEAARDEVQSGYEAGASSLLWKPVLPSRLTEFVRRSLGPARDARRKAEAEAARERARETAPWHRRMWRKASGFLRGRNAIAAAVAAASILVGLCTAALTDGVSSAAEKQERRLDRVIDRWSGPEKAAESALPRWYLMEQIRLGREANEQGRRRLEASESIPVFAEPR